jgi:hypothetical protein
MRTLKLTHEEIETIETALSESYLSRLNIIKDNRPILTQEAISSTLMDGNKFVNLGIEISESQKDI